METRTINPKDNRLLYPLQAFMGYLIHGVFLVIRPFIPRAYRNRISKIETSTLFRNVVGLAFFNALGGLVLMVTNIKLANVLGASIYGVYSYYLAIGEVGQSFVRYGRNKTMTRDLIQMPSKFDSLISNTLILGLINTLLFVIVVILFRQLLEIDLSVATVLLVLAPCIGSLDFQSVYESIKQMSWHSLYLLIQRILFLVAIWFFLIIKGSPSLLYISLSLFISWLFIVLLQYKEIVIGFDIHVSREINTSSILSLYKTNFVIALSTMTGVAFGPVIRMILNNFSDSKVVGVYSAGMQVFLISQFLMHQVSRIGNPMMAEAGKSEKTPNERRRLCRKYTCIMVLTVLPFAIPLCLFPQAITNLLFTDEYSELGHYLPLFSVYLVALSVGIVFTQFLISIRKDKVYFIIYILSALSTVLFSVVLIPHLQLLGAILALCVPHSIGCLFYYICSVKYLH